MLEESSRKDTEGTVQAEDAREAGLASKVCAAIAFQRGTYIRCQLHAEPGVHSQRASVLDLAGSLPGGMNARHVLLGRCHAEAIW